MLQHLHTRIHPVVKLFMTVDERKCKPLRRAVLDPMLPKSFGNVVNALHANVDTEGSAVSE
jgi:hypothetical protein